MTAREIIEILESRIGGTDIFMVDVSVKPGNSVRVLLDRPGGISIDECVDISRFLEERMDRDRDDFSLEVSSPGADAPFRVRQQYESHLGRGVKVMLKDGRKFEGILGSCDRQGIRLATGGSEKEIKFEDIKTTKAIISFK
jgi:ribosome maturation factor RimP